MSLIKKTAKKIIFSLPSSYILMFHHVTGTPQIKQSNCLLDTDKFYEIVDNHNRFASLESVIKQPHKKRIAITFDDSLSDVYEIAYPYLTGRNIPFTIFVITDFLDTPGYITTEQLIDMSKNPLVTIGSHGISHEIFTKMSACQKEKELSESKIILESIIGKSVSIFAYSHGAYDKITLKYAKSSYKYAMSVNEYPLNIFTERKMLIPRINIENSTYEKQSSRLTAWLNKI